MAGYDLTGSASLDTVHTDILMSQLGISQYLQSSQCSMASNNQRWQNGNSLLSLFSFYSARKSVYLRYSVKLLKPKCVHCSLIFQYSYNTKVCHSILLVLVHSENQGQYNLAFASNHLASMVTFFQRPYMSFSLVSFFNTCLSNTVLCSSILRGSDVFNLIEIQIH